MRRPPRPLPGILAVPLCAVALGCPRSAPEPITETSSRPAATTSTTSTAAVPPSATASTDVSPRSTMCTEAVPACRGAVRVGESGSKLAYFASRPLGADDRAPARAVVVIHGAKHDPRGYFQTMTRLATAHGGLEQTVVIAPHFQTRPDTSCFDEVDKPAPGELFWSCDAWKMGGASDSDPNVSSFQALDALVSSIRASFPSIKRITIAGHSAGAQLAQRYAALSQLMEDPDKPLRFLVSSPSSYLYLDGRRLKRGARCASPGDCALDKRAFEVPAALAKSCPEYDDYKYGLGKREGYAAAMSALEVQKQYAWRDVVLLLGERDTGKGPGAGYGELDKSCAAEAEGPFRLERGLVYQRYASLLFGAKQRAEVIPGCGHDEACMFASEKAAGLLFGP
ncbi:MAG: alpha/beta fold hydrolase [Byssovorax sp.]